ncbi:hypothetical protein cypCar_00001975, partial [Cyprinus carpio]
KAELELNLKKDVLGPLDGSSLEALLKGEPLDKRVSTELRPPEDEASLTEGTGTSAASSSTRIRKGRGVGNGKKKMEAAAAAQEDRDKPYACDSEELANGQRRNGSCLQLATGRSETNIVCCDTPKKGPNGLALPNDYCDFCLGDSNMNQKTGQSEELVSCSDCGRSGSWSCHLCLALLKDKASIYQSQNPAME